MEIIAAVELRHNSNSTEHVTISITQEDIERLATQKAEEQHGFYWYAIVQRLEIKLMLVNG